MPPQNPNWYWNWTDAPSAPAPSAPHWAPLGSRQLHSQVLTSTIPYSCLLISNWLKCTPTSTLWFFLYRSISAPSTSNLSHDRYLSSLALNAQRFDFYQRFHGISRSCCCSLESAPAPALFASCSARYRLSRCFGRLYLCSSGILRPTLLRDLGFERQILKLSSSTSDTASQEWHHNSKQPGKDRSWTAFLSKFAWAETNSTFYSFCYPGSDSAHMTATSLGLATKRCTCPK